MAQASVILNTETESGSILHLAAIYGAPCSWRWLASKRKETEKAGYARGGVSSRWEAARAPPS